MPTSLPAAVAASDSSVPALPDVFRAAPTSWRALRRAAGVILLLALGISVLMNPNALHSWASFAITYAYTVCYSVGLWLTNGYVVEWLNRHYPWSSQPLKRLLLTLGVSLGGSVLVIVLMNAVLLLIQGQPLARLWSGQMYWQVLMPLIITVIISLFNHSRSFFFQWRDAAVRAERLEKETAVARLDSLRRQVDPHFLFNSLNALTSLVEENDPPRAVRFIRQLSQVYRYVLDSESQELVPLAQEVRFAESYLYLQQTRLGDALAVEMDLPPAALAPYYVPPLALQMLLENVIKHNAAFQAQPLRVTVTLDAEKQTLTVRNTRRPRRLAPGESSGLGLKNLAARYAFLTDKQLVIGEEAGEFVVTLPLLVL
ncbi:sensor histidine kinase [Hymenobacter properus]|uniref:Histidine kinase n=1 Tax=Hymenobacter properus TaxID=2791026 RepID=A0A931BIJ0_9BACT|nr:histidine kinase [Hymenobacter properus]MBF9144274.1 histidine kinase [Hymenobacter properus]MBR7723092.1 histidine kinase [Microvirga sp. SRT04]